MMNIFLTELKRVFNRWFVLGIIGVAFSITFDSWNDLISSLRNQEGEVYYFISNSAFGGMCREYLLPIFAAVPFATSFCQENKNNCIYYIISREGKKQYGIVKYVVNALSGGLLVAAGTALVLLLLSMVFPIVDSASAYQDVVMDDPFHNWLAVYQPYGYCAVEICMGFLRGIIWSSVALMVSLYIGDPFVVIVSPYLGSYLVRHFFRLTGLGGEFRLDMIFIGRIIVGSSWKTLGIALIAAFIIVSVLGFFFVRKLTRGFKNGTIM